jgi:hypothetical protein
MTTNTHPKTYGGHTNTAPLRRVLVYPPVAPDEAVSWQAFGYFRPIDHEQATAEHAAFRQVIAASGAEVIVGELDTPALQTASSPTTR